MADERKRLHWSPQADIIFKKRTVAKGMENKIQSPLLARQIVDLVIRKHREGDDRRRNVAM